MNFPGHSGNNHPYQGSPYRWSGGFQNQLCNVNGYARPHFPNPQVSEMPFLFYYHGSGPYIGPSSYNEQEKNQGGRSYCYNGPRRVMQNMGGLNRHGIKVPVMNQRISKPQVLDNTGKPSSQSESSGPTCSIDQIKPFLENCIERIKVTLLNDLACTNQYRIERDHENEELETMARKAIEEAMTNSVIKKCFNCKKSIITQGVCNMIQCECGEWTCYECEGPLKNNIKLCNCDFLCPKRGFKSRFMAAGAIKKRELKGKYPTLKFKYDPTKFKVRTNNRLGASTIK